MSKILFKDNMLYITNEELRKKFEKKFVAVAKLCEKKSKELNEILGNVVDTHIVIQIKPRKGNK